MNEINEELSVDPRIHRRHPDITEADVRAAWWSRVRLQLRPDGSGRWSAIGVDGRGRSLEMVATYSYDNGWLVFHALTPPTKSMRKELGLL